MINLPEEERKPAGEESAHDDAQRSGRLPLAFHLAAAGALSELARAGRCIVHVVLRRRLQRSDTRRDTVDLQMLVEQSRRHFAPATQTNCL